MLFIERLAERKILEAMERGEFDDLPGKGKPLPEEPDLAQIPETLRMTYRLLRNAGYVPEEVGLLKSVDDLAAQLEIAAMDCRAETRQRLQLALLRLGSSRFANLQLMEHYYQRLADRFGRETPTSDTCQDNRTPTDSDASGPLRSLRP